MRSANDENLSILIFERFFLNLASLGKARQVVNSDISLFLTIINSKVVAQKFLGPADLTRTQVFCIHELLKFIEVTKDKDLIFTAF